MSPGLRLANAMLAGLVLVICALMVAPTLAIVPISFTTTDFISFPPHGFSWRWYAALLDAD